MFDLKRPAQNPHDGHKHSEQWTVMPANQVPCRDTWREAGLDINDCWLCADSGARREPEGCRGAGRRHGTRPRQSDSYQGKRPERLAIGAAASNCMAVAWGIKHVESATVGGYVAKVAASSKGSDNMRSTRFFGEVMDKASLSTEIMRAGHVDIKLSLASWRELHRSAIARLTELAASSILKCEYSLMSFTGMRQLRQSLQA